MSPAAEIENQEWSEAIKNWQMGDYSLEVPQIVLMTGVDGGDFVPEAFDAVGLVAISQTCDIVNSGKGKEWVTVAALVGVDADQLSQIAAGRTPIFAELECPPHPSVVANLTQTMTVHKSVLAGLSRRRGFDTDEALCRFANVLSRKQGRFAFPDLFAGVLKALRERIADSHKKNSDNGKAYRSIRSIRAVASPQWEASNVKVGFRILLRAEENCEAERSVISSTLTSHFAKLKWPNGFSAEDPPFLLYSAREISLDEWENSQEVDLTFISWPEEPS